MSQPPPLVTPPQVVYVAQPQKKWGCFKIFLLLIVGLVGLTVLAAVVGGIGSGYAEAKKTQAEAKERVRVAALSPEERAEEEKMRAAIEADERAAEDEKAKQKAAGEAAKLAEREKRIQEIQWPEIDAIYAIDSKVTDLAKDEKWKAYKGREVRWTGRVAEVKEGMLGGLSLMVKMKSDTLTFDVMVDLREDQKQKAINLSVGDRVTFEAKLESWGTLMPITAKEGVIKN